MADTINAEDHSREELNKLATDAGLTDAAKYSNKPAVADAINRVNGGEDAAAVNAELTASTPPDKQATPTPSKAGMRATASPKQSEKKIHAVNGGHPTQFDATGNPVYDPKQV